MKSDIQRIRREALRRLVEKHGGPTTLGRMLGFKGPSYVSQMVTGLRPITEKTARKIEEALELKQWALDQPDGKAVPFAGSATRELLAQVIMAVERELEGFRGTLTSERRAKLVAEIYEHSAARGAVDRDYISRLVQLLA